MTATALQVLHVSTADPLLADEVMGASFPGIAFSAGDDGVPFGFTHRRVADGVFAVNRLALTGRASSGGEFPEVAAAGRLLRGRSTVAYGQRGLDTTRPYVRPPGRQRARFQDASLELLTVEPDHFVQQATLHLTGTGAVLRAMTVDNSAPVSADAATLWHSTVDHIIRVADDPEVFALPMVRATLIDLYVATMLATFPLTLALRSAAGTSALPGALQRALQYLEEHVAEPITTPMIAEAARVSVRGLHQQFASRLGTTPMRHLRRLRLQAAHSDLEAADAVGDVTTAAVARRWGFTHLPRFAQHYRDAFGELPSHTLRR